MFHIDTIRLTGLALFAALASIPAQAKDFSISFRWCSGSSEITLDAVPKDTVKLDARMSDLWVPSFDHGGGKVAYKGQKSIPCGALSGFVGPSPPPPQVHDYQWTVQALSADGTVLATAKATRKFPEH